MSTAMRREPAARSSLGGVVSKLATDLAAARADLETTRTLLARREKELAAAESRHEAALRAVQLLTREQENLADLYGSAEGTLGILHESLRDQARLRSRQHKALAAAGADRAFLTALADRMLGQLATIEQRPSAASALLGSLLGWPETIPSTAPALPPRGRSVLLLALGLPADDVRGVVALAMKEPADDGVVPVLATDAALQVGPIVTLPLPRPRHLRRLPRGLTADDYLRERILCLCRRLVPTRVVAFGPLATRLVAELRSSGETLELTAPGTAPSGHAPTDDGPS